MIHDVIKSIWSLHVAKSYLIVSNGSFGLNLGQKTLPLIEFDFGLFLVFKGSHLCLLKVVETMCKLLKSFDWTLVEFLCKKKVFRTCSDSTLLHKNQIFEKSLKIKEKSLEVVPYIVGNPWMSSLFLMLSPGANLASKMVKITSYYRRVKLENIFLHKSWDFRCLGLWTSLRRLEKS